MGKSNQNLVFPFNFLSNTSQKIPIYLFGAVAISTFPALAVSYLIYAFFPEADTPSFPEGPIALFFAIVVFAPIIETLFLWIGISIIKKFISSVWITTFVSSGIWALLHSLGTFAHGFAIFWSFVVFSYLLIIWQKKSRDYALGMCTSVHMMQNFIVFLIMQIP